MDTAALLAEINKIPPVTRFIAGSSLAVTLPVMLQVLSPYSIIYVSKLVFERLEVWRLWTSFFYGGTGLAFLFDFVMMFRTSNALETEFYTWRPADYAWQLCLATLGILGLNHPLGSFLHYRPLLITLVYLSSRLSPNRPSSLFGLITIPALWWPYVLVSLDGIIYGKKVLVQSFTGIVIGHAWWLLVWRDVTTQLSPLLQTPQWVKKLLPPITVPPGTSGPQPRGFGAAPGGAPQTTGGQPAGHRWGAGHRLGDG